MRERALDLLRCPSCGGGLRIIEGRVRERELENGRLACLECTRTYPVSRRVPRLFRDAPAHAEFEAQWQLRSEGALETTERLFAISPSAFADLVVRAVHDPTPGECLVDAGCGTVERAAALAARYPETDVVAFDVVAGVERGAEMFQRHSNLHVVQADVRAPPVAKSRAQKVVSWGVLHLLPDPHAAFRSLASCVARGGAMLIWMYPHPSEDGGGWRPYYFVRDVIFANRAHRLPPRARLLASRLLCGAMLLPLWVGYRTHASKAEQYPELRNLGLRDIYDGGTMNVFDMLTPGSSSTR